MNTKSVPTLYEWAGGMAALERLTNHFYDRVRQDKMLSPVFAQMHGALGIGRGRWSISALTAVEDGHEIGCRRRS
jgi:truncated hemoglobin YjbI